MIIDKLLALIGISLLFWLIWDVTNDLSAITPEGIGDFLGRIVAAFNEASDQ